jgi:hypothetical protein
MTAKVEMFVADEDEPSGSARGLVFGVLLGLSLWAVLLVGVAVWWIAAHGSVMGNLGREAVTSGVVPIG